MLPTVLEKIVQTKREAIALKKQAMPLASFIDDLQPSDRSFYDALQKQKDQQQPIFILECKKASPSKGLLRSNFDVKAIAGIYKHYATAISVLTEEHYFQGEYENIKRVRDIASQPVLCKDFIVDPYQVYLARYYGADAILLMLSVLSQAQYKALTEIAHNLGMGVLTEVINEQELKVAVDSVAKVIGINNRNLHDLTVDLNVSKKLSVFVPSERILISESGVQTHHQVEELSQYVDGFLIGSSLMKESDLNSAVRKVVYGENKICGLMKPEDAVVTYASGFYHGGLIFVPSSPRFVTTEQAEQIQIAAPLLKYVGVFQNEKLETVAQVASNLNLYAVQLHGIEDQTYITALKGLLPADCQIWKALSVKDQLPEFNLHGVDLYLLDGTQAGSGEAFDWSLLKGQKLDRTMIAGGLTQDNCQPLLPYWPKGLDFNSGVEIHTAHNKDEKRKDHSKIQQLSKKLQQIRK